MIKFILGPSGSGKSKHMVDMVDEDIKENIGEIIFIATEDFSTTALDIKIRFINVSEYKIENIEQLKGFIAGIFSMNYDINKIYFDGIYKISKLDKEDINDFVEFIQDLIKDGKPEVIIGLDNEIEDLPKECMEAAVELEV